MEPAHFDRRTKRLATQPLTRRRAVAAVTALLASVIGPLREETSAQSATPASPPSTGAEAANNTTLFVQTATGGTIAANPAAAVSTPATPGTATAAQRGACLLTLHDPTQGRRSPSDRPQRDFSEVETPRFF